MAVTRDIGPQLGPHVYARFARVVPQQATLARQQMGRDVDAWAGVRGVHLDDRRVSAVWQRAGIANAAIGPAHGAASRAPVVPVVYVHAGGRARMVRSCACVGRAVSIRDSTVAQSAILWIG